MALPVQRAIFHPERLDRIAQAMEIIYRSTNSLLLLYIGGEYVIHSSLSSPEQQEGNIAPVWPKPKGKHVKK